MSANPYPDVLYSYTYTSDNGAYHLDQVVNDGPEAYTYDQYARLTGYVPLHSSFNGYYALPVNIYEIYSSNYINEDSGVSSAYYNAYSRYGYRSYSTYNPSYQGYSLARTYYGPDYANYAYSLYINGGTGSSESQYEYNSGRLQGYVFVNYINYASYDAGGGTYDKSTYYANSEGYYDAQHGVQGDFGPSTYYYTVSYSPA